MPSLIRQQDRLLSLKKKKKDKAGKLTGKWAFHVTGPIKLEFL